jgi:hypothetical protein
MDLLVRDLKRRLISPKSLGSDQCRGLAWYLLEGSEGLGVAVLSECVV